MSSNFLVFLSLNVLLYIFVLFFCCLLLRKNILDMHAHAVYWRDRQGTPALCDRSPDMRITAPHFVYTGIVSLFPGDLAWIPDVFHYKTNVTLRTSETVVCVLTIAWIPDGLIITVKNQFILWSFFNKGLYIDCHYQKWSFHFTVYVSILGCNID